MKKTALVLAASLAAFATPAAAQEVSEITADPEFVAKLRSALEQHPELVTIAATRHQAMMREQEMAAMVAKADEVRSELSASKSVALVLGNPQGADTYIEFLDYRCGFCRRAHEDVNALMAQDSNARVVVMMLPVLGPDSETLARFALAAAQLGKFREANDYMYENAVEADDAGLEAVANAIGADWTAIRSAMSSEEVSGKLAIHRAYADRLQLQGTPFFITPTKVHPGYVPLEQLMG